MPPKKKQEKKEEAPKEKEVLSPAASALEDAAELLGKQGIIATFSHDSNKIMHRNVRDISVSNLTVTLHGTPIIEDADLTLNYGNRYGFIGRNGSGKSTFMKVIASRCFPIPEGIDIYHLAEEIPATDLTAKEAVMSVDSERKALEEEADRLNDLLVDENEDQDSIQERLSQIYERLEEMDAATAEVRASKILNGLGFTPDKQSKKTKEFSGGWRMRIALARALFIQPTLLLLDEPTNHLDMEAVVWLEDYLSKWTKILFFVSHSQDFMNTVCTHMVHLHKKKLNYYTGNYDTFIQTRKELEEEQMKRYQWEQDQIKHMKEYVARFGHGTAKNAKQAQSKEKTLEKMVRGGLTEKVEADKAMDFKFSDPGKLSPPVLQCNDLTFGYPGREILYAGVDFGIDLDSRVALVGPNGAGKSTLLKIITGELIPLTGSVRPHAHLRISKFSQHFIDVLDLTLNPLDYFLKTWPDMTREEGRRFLGRFGISGPVQTQVMEQLSDGQKSRVVFAKIAKENPHLILLDEPTNHLDMESIDSLAKAINIFEGGLVLVSHDMRLISQVAKEIWVCDNRTVCKYTGEISDFKMQLRRQMNLSASDRNEGKSMLVPLVPPKSGANAIRESEEILRARQELAQMNIKKAEPTVPVAPVAPIVQPEVKTVAPAAKDTNAESAGTTDGEGNESVLDEKTRLKLKKKAEKEAALARKAQEEAEKAQRRAEKLADMEEAKRIKELEDAAREQRAIERAEKANKKKLEDEALAAKEEAERAQRKAEREAKAREKELEKKRYIERKKQEWMDAARQDVWTQEQQTAFEEALLSAPIGNNFAGSGVESDRVNRWLYISSKVPEKTPNQCLLRYKLLVQVVADRNAANNSSA